MNPGAMAVARGVRAVANVSEAGEAQDTAKQLRGEAIFVNERGVFRCATPSERRILHRYYQGLNGEGAR